jgi:hypothetical protein
MDALQTLEAHLNEVACILGPDSALNAEAIRHLNLAYAALNDIKMEYRKADIDSVNYRGACGTCGMQNMHMLTDNFCANCATNKATETTRLEAKIAFDRFTDLTNVLADSLKDRDHARNELERVSRVLKSRPFLDCGCCVDQASHNGCWIAEITKGIDDRLNGFASAKRTAEMEGACTRL